MSSEQELFWNILKNDPATRAHILGKELGAIRDLPDEVNARVDEFLAEQLSSNATPKELVQMFKTLLGTYKLPLLPGKLRSYDLFVKRCTTLLTEDAALPLEERKLNAYPIPAGL